MSGDIAKLLELAQAATQGPWIVDELLYEANRAEVRGEYGRDPKTHARTVPIVVDGASLADANYIAAVSPEALMPLLLELRRLRAQNEVRALLSTVQEPAALGPNGLRMTDAVEVPHAATTRTVLERLRTLTADESRQMFIDAGIYDAEGNLMPNYANTPATSDLHQYLKEVSEAAHAMNDVPTLRAAAGQLYNEYTRVKDELAEAHARIKECEAQLARKLTRCPSEDCVHGTVYHDNGMRAKCYQCQGRGYVP